MTKTHRDLAGNKLRRSRLYRGPVVAPRGPLGSLADGGLGGELRLLSLLLQGSSKFALICSAHDPPREREQRMDELAREYHETHDPKIPDEICRLTRLLKELDAAGARANFLR